MIVSSSTSAKGTDTTQGAQVAQPGGALGKDQFLKLLIAQLKNQDPMSPLQGDQMASQLAQFSSLEQLQQINTNLAGQQTSSSTLLGAVQSSAAINTIGHTVVALGDQLQVGGANAANSVEATFGAAATKATLHILNSSGKEVASQSLGQVGAGKQTFNLGKMTEGLAPGTYTYSIDATDSSGSPVKVQTYTTARIDGVSSGQNGLVLTAGGITIPYGSIVRIFN
jgi:flagellar basal-body rod modification protein FlgD